MTNPRGKCKKEDLAQWVFLSLEKSLSSSNIKADFKECGIWPFNPQAMRNKIEPSYTIKAMNVEVEEYIEEILENKGLHSGENNTIHYFVEHEVSDEDPQVTAIGVSTLHYTNFLQVP